jgi:C-terminal processing protease CtpA/Prc
MKKTIFYLLATLLAFGATSCSFFDNQSTPAGYVRHCIRLLDRDGLYADSPEWKAKKKEVLASAKTISTMEEAHSCVEDAGYVAGGKHTFLQAPVTDTTTYPEVAPKVKMLEDGILHIVIPAHTGVKVSDSLYIHTVFDYLQEHLDAKGVIIDLRENTGGNMYPMITAVSPLLPDGVILKFKSRKRMTPITLEYVVKSYQIAPDSIGKIPSPTPIAILTSPHTGSSGEATLLCFRGLDNVRTFGGPSAGYASGNVTHLLADGYKLAITRSCDVARTGEVFCNDPIEPDVPTETPVEEAVRWISGGQ